MNNHTPGKWTVEPDGHINSDETWICTTDDEANARLIAAAPGMYAVLAQICTDVAALASGDCDDITAPEELFIERMMANVEDARRAIES